MGQKVSQPERWLYRICCLGDLHDQELRAEKELAVCLAQKIERNQASIEGIRNLNKPTSVHDRLFDGAGHYVGHRLLESDAV